MTNAVPLPPPYQGQNDRIPIPALQSPFCEIIQNYNLDNGIPTLRKGDSAFVDGTGVVQPIFHLVCYGQGSSQKLFMVTSGSGSVDWYDISAGTIVGRTLTISSSDVDIQTLYFNGWLFFFAETSFGSAPQAYNGAVWGPCTYSFAGSGIPYGGCVHKHRAYILKRASSEYVYSGIDAISGATTARDLGGVMTNKGYIYGIRSIALAEGISQENVLAFICDTGEVLVFSGSWPDSPDWTIVGRFVIPKPIDYNSFIDCKGDSYVITECGLISLRDLFTKGQTRALTEAITDPITNRWDQICSDLYPVKVLGPTTYRTRGVYDQASDRIEVFFPLTVSRTTGALGTGSLRLVYSFKTNSWVEHVNAVNESSYVIASAFFKNNIYYATTRAWVRKLEGATDFIDVPDTPIVYNLRTAPLPTKRFGVSRGTGVEIIMKSDLYDQTNFTLVGDFGVSQTTAQTVSGNGVNMSKPLVNAGIEAGYIQLDIAGATVAGKSTGQQIYGINLWNEDGGLR